ncbi:uncharacterized protein LOC110443536 [Mizuhopecten yessoensis]|uniref:uncharacterized protein LOC110443536 n=1 Tax=Mizuhopecten yessoensis TaxID=6573 RepID=UPI000B458038|nr:uncharacterized protein LOC110443536 [Mizuhopecten yessoensis]
MELIILSEVFILMKTLNGLFYSSYHSLIRNRFKISDKNLDIVLSLANEYQTADLLRKCVEVINQRVESLSEVSIYIPPSRIVTYLRWIEKFNIDDAKACVVKSASYLEGKKLQKEPGYKDIGYELKLEISYARAELLESLFVVTVEEIMEKIQQLKIPVSMHYLPIWRKNITKIIRNEVQLKGVDRITPILYREKKTKEQLPGIFASMYICDKLKLTRTYEVCLTSLKLSKIKRADFEKGWSSYFADISYAKERESGKLHALHFCDCSY